MSISKTSGFRSIDMSQTAPMQEVSAPVSQEIHAQQGSGSVDLAALRGNLDISLRNAVASLLSGNPLVESLSGEQRASLVASVESSLRQGVGISALLRLINSART